MTGNYGELLRTYELATDTEAARIALGGLCSYWHQEAAQDDPGRIDVATTQLDDFYRDNDALYATANSTTGDTDRQISDLKRFTTEYSGELTCGSVADIGCGNGTRITVPMATMLSNCDVVGIDHRVPDITDGPSNLSFKTGDF